MDRLSNPHTYSDGVNRWLVSDLWLASKGLPVTYKPMSELEWVLETCCWSKSSDGNLLPLTAKDIIDHSIRIQNAKLTIYPILLNKFGHVLDGVHRLAYAYINSWKEIPVQILENMPPPFKPL